MSQQILTPRSRMRPAGILQQHLANRLAFEALACLPCFPQGRRVRTTGFEDERVMRWPLWSAPIDLSTLRSLLAHPAVIRRERMMLACMGVFAVASSRRSSVGRKRTFGPAELWPVPHVKLGTVEAEIPKE